MHRSLIQSLREWKNSPARQPLLLSGARQTGKTYLVEQFGTTDFTHQLKINFEKEKQFTECFKTLDPKQIIIDLQIATRQEIVPGKTLLFFDEIQACPRAMIALRYSRMKPNRARCSGLNAPFTGHMRPMSLT